MSQCRVQNIDKWNNRFKELFPVLCPIEIVSAAVNSTMSTVIWGISNYCFRKFKVKCRYAKYKISTNETTLPPSSVWVPSRLTLQRLLELSFEVFRIMHCFRKFECVIRKWNCPTVIISNITMLSIQNFKEDISYVIIKKVCDLIIVLDGLNGVSMVQTLFNVSLLCSRFNNWKIQAVF